MRIFHAKDCCYPLYKDDLEEEKRIGDGKVNFKAVYTKFKSPCYDSFVTIEREIDGEEQTRDILYVKEHLQCIIDKVYTN